MELCNFFTTKLIPWLLEEHRMFLSPSTLRYHSFSQYISKKATTISVLMSLDTALRRKVSEQVIVPRII